MPRRPRAFWIRLVTQHQQSGLTAVAFAARRGVSVGTLRSWIYRLRRADVAKTAVPALMPVRVVAAPAATANGRPAVVEVLLVGGVRVRAAVGTEPGYVAALAAALSDAC